MEKINNILTTAAIKVLPLRERASFFTHNDNKLFQYIITKYKNILFDINTDNYTKRQKQRAWLAILDEFNMAADEPRSLKKLKFKFHNTKTKARKNANDSKPGRKPCTTNSNDIKWMQSIMAASVAEQSEHVEDFCINNNQDEELERSQIEIVQYNPLKTKDDDVIEVPIINDNDNDTMGKHFDMEVQVDVKENIVPEPKDPLSTKSPLGKILKNKPTTKKDEAIKTPVADNQLNMNKSKRLSNYEKRLYKLRARHMQEQRDEEHELFQLKKRKLLMEINLLVK